MLECYTWLVRSGVAGVVKKAASGSTTLGRARLMASWPLRGICTVRARGRTRANASLIWVHHPGIVDQQGHLRAGQHGGGDLPRIGNVEANADDPQLGDCLRVASSAVDLLRPVLPQYPGNCRPNPRFAPVTNAVAPLMYKLLHLYPPRTWHDTKPSPRPVQSPVTPRPSQRGPESPLKTINAGYRAAHGPPISHAPPARRDRDH
jgi:hypothetical protein